MNTDLKVTLDFTFGENHEAGQAIMKALVGAQDILKRAHLMAVLYEEEIALDGLRADLEVAINLLRDLLFDEGGKPKLTVNKKEDSMIPQEMIDKAVKEVDERVGKKRPKDELDQLREWAENNILRDLRYPSVELLSLRALLDIIQRLKDARGKA